jgi:capsular exopolysaccharide synthesis family protein
VKSVPWQTTKFSARSAGEDEFSGRLVTVLDPTNPASEAYRILCTSLLYTLAGSSLQAAIVVTSPGRAEGKSTVCANLGVVLAQAGNRTLILDCNLREPAIHRIFGLPITPGIAEVIGDNCDLEEACQEPLSGLKVLTAGATIPKPTEVLSSQRFLELVVNARQEFDYVLIDSPPTANLPDPGIIATQGDGVLLVLDAQKTDRKNLHRAARTLNAAGANILGTVMNDLRET